MDHLLDSVCEYDLHNALGSVAPGGFWEDGCYVAACPLHADEEFSFRYQKSTRTWQCTFGCGGGDLVALGVRLWKCGIGDANARLLSLCGENLRQVVRRYAYLDAAGQFVFEVLRYSPKAFHARVPVSWMWIECARIPELHRVLYRLPEMLSASDVLIVEGERDCETARAMGWVAACNPGGGGRWHQDYVELFRGKRVCIIADADATGRSHAQHIAGSLVPVAESVKLVEFANVKDLTEWVEGGGTCEQLRAMFHQAPSLKSTDVEGWWDPARPVRLQCEADFLLQATVPPTQIPMFA